jgi:streptogramin lyase
MLRILLVVLVAAFVGARLIELRLDPPGGRVAGARGTAKERPPPAPAPLVGAAVIQGTITRSGAQAPGVVMVSARGLDATSLHVTVYANNGRFRIKHLPPGRFELSAQTTLLESTPAVVTAAEDSPSIVNLSLDGAKSRDYPATSYAAALNFPTEQARLDFRMQCEYCHQQGSAVTRRNRSAAEWNALLDLMTAMGASLRADTRKGLAQMLSVRYGEVPKDLPPPLEPSDIPPWTELREYALGEPGAYDHDLALGAFGQWVYAVDMNQDLVYGIHRWTGESKTFELPDRGRPRGGFFEAASRPLGTLLARQGPHSVEMGPDGRLYITDALGNALLALDPRSGATQTWDLPRGGYYPHTLRVKPGVVWFTVALSNQLGRLDLGTNNVTLRRLPLSNWEQWLGNLFLGPALAFGSLSPHQDRHVRFAIGNLSGNGSRYLPLPYGIDLGPDGAVWYSKLYDDRIGRFDPRTGALKEWQTPFKGPRRLAVAKDGVVWIPAFGSGLLARFDPKAEHFVTFPIPAVPVGAEAPYAVGVSPTGEVWVTGTQADALYRFDPVYQRFTVYPLPTRVAFMREVEFTSQGEVCTTYSNIPDSHMPDARLRLACLRTASSE